MKVTYCVMSTGISRREMLNPPFMAYTHGMEFMINECDASVDVVYAAHLRVLETAYSIAVKYRKPLVCWVWDVPDAHPAYMLLKNCQLVLSASKYTADKLAARGIKSTVVKYYIDTRALDNVPSTEYKTKSVIQIGRFVPSKRFDLSIVATGVLGYLYTAVGYTGQHPREFTRCVYLAEAVNKRANFIPNAPRAVLARELRSALALVSPSVYEGWGMTPIEATYCGVPVLISDIPAHRETFRDAALYHEPDNTGDIVCKLQQLIETPALREEIVGACKPRITEFTPQKFAERWQEVMNTV